MHTGKHLSGCRKHPVKSAQYFAVLSLVCLYCGLIRMYAVQERLCLNKTVFRRYVWKYEGDQGLRSGSEELIFNPS